MGITIFLGAGAAIDVGGPSTDHVTKLIRQKRQIFFNRELAIIDKIGEILDKDFEPDKCNFEDIFYSLEMLTSYNRAWSQPVNKKYRPPFASFSIPKFQTLFPPNAGTALEQLPLGAASDEDIFLNVAKRDLINVVANTINDYDIIYNTVQNNWAHKFWQKIADKTHCDIATLNYDTTVEKSLGQFDDGFEETQDGFSRFNPSKLIGGVKSTILHLHGCIIYGYGSPKDDINKYAFEDSWEDVHKFNDYDSAKKTWNPKSNYQAQSSEETIIGPLITGLRKTDKMVVYPYSFYYYKLQDAILKNSSLLIIGYSFGDLHLNEMLSRIARLHGSKKKIVVITFFDFKKNIWIPDSHNMPWPPYEERIFYQKMFQDTFVLNQAKGVNVKDGLPIVSKDKNTRIYLRGFKHAVENHMDDIISFLSAQ